MRLVNDVSNPAVSTKCAHSDLNVQNSKNQGHNDHHVHMKRAIYSRILVSRALSSGRLGSKWRNFRRSVIFCRSRAESRPSSSGCVVCIVPFSAFNLSAGNSALQVSHYHGVRQRHEKCFRLKYQSQRQKAVVRRKQDFQPIGYFKRLHTGAHSPFRHCLHLCWLALQKSRQRSLPVLHWLGSASLKESSIRDYRSTNRIRKSTTYFCLILADTKNISCLRTSLFESGNLQYLCHLSRPTAPEKNLHTKKIQPRTHKTSKMQALDKACILVLGVSQRESKLTSNTSLTW